MSVANSHQLTTWHLNAIVLCHLNRFFHAAANVIHGWRDNDRDLLGSLLTLSGNMLWARSSFEAQSKEQEQSMAYTGAVVSSVAEQAVSRVGEKRKQQALSILASVERQVHETYDLLLTVLMQELQAAGLAQASPSRVNAAVWSLLFPVYPYVCGHDELSEAIRARLTA